MGTRDVILRKLAEEIGWEFREGAPDGYWCLSAEDAGYKDRHSGPWFRKPGEKGWGCALCSLDLPDPFEDANADYAILEWLRRQDHPVLRSIGDAKDYRIGDYAAALARAYFIDISSI